MSAAPTRPKRLRCRGCAAGASVAAALTSARVSTVVMVERIVKVRITEEDKADERA